MKKSKATTLFDLRCAWKFQSSDLRQQFFNQARDEHDSVLINRSKLRPLYVRGVAPRGKALWHLLFIQDRRNSFNVLMPGSRPTPGGRK
ncbi:hypothetical protein PN823_004433 [Enterobacter hormaechei]|nr:hypothetical protein [Enterobacter hormaechei]